MSEKCDAVLTLVKISNRESGSLYARRPQAGDGKPFVTVLARARINRSALSLTAAIAPLSTLRLPPIGV